jgi:transcriptional regulator with XRE-family HTH domain
MTQASVNPQELIAERMAAIRRYKGMTQSQLAEAMQELGVPWQRIIVAKIEGGRRDFLTVEELLALCIALEISPVDLLVPRELKDDDPYHVTPQATARATDVREWVRGEGTLFYRLDRDEEEQREKRENRQREGRMRFASPTGKISDPTAWMPAVRAQRLEERDRYIQEEAGRALEERYRQLKEEGDRDR